MKKSKHSKSSSATTVRLQRIYEENRRLKLLVADLPFYKVLLQEKLAKKI
jgi:hypothetical protein